MNNWTLDAAPAALNEEARQGWVTPTSAQPSTGEIWLLSWNGRPEALALITSVYPDFIRAMPITLGEEGAGQTEAILADQALGSPATIWFHAETGLGHFLLHRRITAALTTKEIRAMRETAYTEAAPTFRVGTTDTEAAERERERTLTQFQRLCYIEWPTSLAGEAQLDTSILEGAGLDIAGFADLVQLGTAAAFELWTGERPVPSPISAALEELLHLRSDEFLRVSNDAAVTQLRSTGLKDLIATVSLVTQTDERDVRNQARSSYALAARTDTVTGREMAALREVLEAQLPAQDDDARRR